jgi:hypothetical protein
MSGFAAKKLWISIFEILIADRTTIVSFSRSYPERNAKHNVELKLTTGAKAYTGTIYFVRGGEVCRLTIIAVSSPLQSLKWGLQEISMSVSNELLHSHSSATTFAIETMV